jgi:hypothetical protein
VNAELEAIDLPAPVDDRAIRRAVLRGVARSGLASLAWLLVLVLVLFFVTVGVGLVRGDRFFVVTFNGLRAAHPEYELAQDGSCCARGPLFGLTNLGLASSVTLRVRPLGELDYAPTTTVVVEQDVTGALHADLGRDVTPLRDGLNRGRPGKGSTGEFLDGLPDLTVVSALVEYDRPVAAASFRALPGLSAPIFLTDPYASGLVAWPTLSVDELRDWARRLGPADDDRLDEIGLPPAATIQRAAADGLIHAYVLPRIGVGDIRALLDDPAVRSVNILDVAFDTARQTPA